MQHGAIGLVANRAQQRTLGLAGVCQQRQRLVGMRGQNHLVKGLAGALRDDAHAAAPHLRVALYAQHGRVQSLVGNAGRDLVNIVARAALDRPPLRAVGNLQQAVVVAKADHRGHRKAQHLLNRA